MAKQKPTTETESTELVLIQPLNDVVIKSGLELSKAEKYALGYAPLMGEVIAIQEMIKGLDKTNPEHAKIAKRASLDIGKICSRLTDKKASDKSDLLLETKHIDNLFNLATSTARLTQKDADVIAEYAETLEKERLTALADIRRAELESYGADTSYLPLEIMGDEQYARCLESAQLAFEARKVAAEKLESERLAEIERVRLADIEAARLQAERIEAERLEAIRVKEELAAKEQELVKEREANAERERLRIDAENKAKKNREVLNRRFEQMILKEISALGFTPVENGIENAELGWFIGKRHYDGFDTEAEAIEWFKETKERVRVMTEQAAETKYAAQQLAEKEKQNARQSAMFALGLQWDGQMFHYQDINFHWTDLLCMDDSTFDKNLKGATKRMEVLKAEQADKERAAKAESERIEKKLREMAEAEAKEIDAKNRAMTGPDKDKINALYLSLKNLAIPEFTSIECQVIGTEVVNKISHILSYIKAESKKLS